MSIGLRIAFVLFSQILLIGFLSYNYVVFYETDKIVLGFIAVLSAVLTTIVTLVKLLPSKTITFVQDYAVFVLRHINSFLIVTAALWLLSIGWTYSMSNDLVGRLVYVNDLQDSMSRGALDLPRDALLQLGTPPFHLRPCEVLVPVVNRLELAAIDRNARYREEAHLTAKLDEAGTDLAEPQAVVLAEVCDRLVIRSEPTQQPHHLDIASGFSFEPPAGLHPVQIAVDVKLQENRRMVRRSTSRRWLNPIEAHLGQIERIHKHVDHANRVAPVNEIIEAFGQ